jgi:hypothetical protein
MAAPIGVEAQRQAMSAKHFLKPTKRRGRAFFRHQQRRLDRARRVIHGHDEIERRPTAQPFVSQRVLMRYHSRQRPARALAPLCATPLRLLQQAFRRKPVGPVHQVHLVHRVIQDEIMVGGWK